MVVRDLPKVEAPVRFWYPAPVLRRACYKKPMGKVTNSTIDLWFRKLQVQINIIHQKEISERTERTYASEIALAYLFLYLFVEATIDKIIENLLCIPDPIAGNREYGKYKEQPKNLKSKLEFLFKTFCGQLPFEEYSKLIDKLKDLINMRNRVVHIDEISWMINVSPEGFKESPTSYTKNLTVEALKRHCGLTQDFLDALKIVLKKAFVGKTIDVDHVRGDKVETKALDYIDWIYEVSIMRRLEPFDNDFVNSGDEP